VAVVHGRCRCEGVDLPYLERFAVVLGSCV
jgi:hypothetical protein